MIRRSVAFIGVHLLSAVLSGGSAFTFNITTQTGSPDPVVRQPPACSSQTDLDSLLAASAQAYTTRDAVRGFALLNEAFKLATANGCVVHRAEALLRLAFADSYTLRHDAARLKLVEAIAVFRQYGVADREAEALTELGLALVAMAKPREAVGPLVRAQILARQASDRRLQLRILEALAYAMDEGPEKETLRREGLEFARAAPDGRSAECSIFHEWGDQLFSEDRYGPAFERLTDAARCFEEVGDSSRLARAYVSLGRVYRAHGRLDTALEQYARAVALGRSPGDPLSEVQSLNAIGVTLGALGRFDEGLERLQEALGIARRLGSARSVEFLRANIASFHMDRGRYAEAAAVLEETLASPAPAFEVVRLVDLTKAYLGLRRTDRALETADRAVSLAPAGLRERVIALAARADVLIALKRYDAAAADLRVAVEVIEALRANTIPDDYLKRGFGQNYQWVFSSTISLAQEQGRPRDAIEAAERARARAFLDLLASRARGASAPDARSRGVAAATFPEIVTAASRLRSTVVAFWVGPSETFVWVVKGDGSIASARIAVTETELVSMVRDATGVGGGASARSGGMLLGAGSTARPWRALYRLLLDPVRQHLPASPGSRLTVVPHGPLFGLPFAALRDGTDRYLIESYEIHYVPAVGALSFKSPPRSARSGSALLVGDPGPDAARDQVMALPPLPWAGREVATIGRLLESRATVLVGADASEARVRESLSGRTLLHFATHGIVQNEERLSSYLALRPAVSPSVQKCATGRPGSDPASRGDCVTNPVFPRNDLAGDATDGRLTANEMYGLDLDADLVVLSGCRTALGPILGDGVIGFTRAFLASGATSVVATMWDVPDQTSFEVMKSFYEAWVGGAEKNVALRQAQLSVMRALRAGKIRVGGVALPESPRLWAGYVLVGRP